jgi:hypothetical protein
MSSDSKGGSPPVALGSHSPSTTVKKKPLQSSPGVDADIGNDLILQKKVHAAQQKLQSLLASPRGKNVIESEQKRHGCTEEQVVLKLSESVRQSVIKQYKQQLATVQRANAALKAEEEASSSSRSTTVVKDAAPAAASSSQQPQPEEGQDPTTHRLKESQFLNAALELMDEQSKTVEDMNTLRHEVAQLLEQMETTLKSLPASIIGCVWHDIAATCTASGNTDFCPRTRLGPAHEAEFARLGLSTRTPPAPPLVRIWVLIWLHCSRTLTPPLPPRRSIHAVVCCGGVRTQVCEQGQRSAAAVCQRGTHQPCGR